MAGYTRQDTANNIANGNVIDADDFDAEYNAVEAAFNASTGHKHDGTAGEGAPIEKVGPSQDLVVSATQVLPKTTNTLDLGSSAVQFKDAFFDGQLNADVLLVDQTSQLVGAVVASDTMSVGSTLNVTGQTTLQDNTSVTGTLTVSSDVTASGAMNITGNTGVDGDFDVNTNKFTVASATGNTAIAGTLAVTGTSTLTGAVSAPAGVTGDLTGNADTATTWETARSITLTGDVTGTISGVDGSGDVSIATTVEPNSVALGTDTTGDYVASLVEGIGVIFTNNSGEGATPTIAIGQAVSTTSDVTFNDVTVSGDLTVSGTTTYVDTTHLNVSDNQIILNYDVTGTPTENAGIEVERGTAANKTLVWNETDDKWTVGSETFVAGTFEGNLTGNVTGNVTGNADTATTLATARTIAGQSFDGSSNISIAPTDLTGVTATAAEINKLDGYTGTATDLNEAVAHYVPSGGIIMWSGAVSAIPTGWVLCDGTNSTPNLVDRFIVGSGTDSGGTHDVGDTGGANSITLTEAQLPSHTHGAGTLSADAAGSHDHDYARAEQNQGPYALQDGGVLWGYNNTRQTSTEPDHTHTISGSTGSTGSGSSIDNRPAYYALAFIMKT